VRISAIVDACFRLIVDGETAPSVTALRKRASSGLNISQSSTISLKRAVVGPVIGLVLGLVDF
jgi:ABC-type nitrate/sulfonate/bicarbonate transport system permease component